MRKTCLAIFFAVAMVLGLEAGEDFRQYNYFKGSGTADPQATEKTAKILKDSGIYCWWELFFTLPPGQYQVYARVRAGQPVDFNLQVYSQNNGKKMPVTLGCRVTGNTYKEVLLGIFNYDGSYPIRFSDWTPPGMWLDYIYLKPVKLSPRADKLEYPTSKLTDWCVMPKTAVSLNRKLKKDSEASIDVNIKAPTGSPWENGVCRRLNAGKAKLISFWIYWKSEPSTLYLMLIGKNNMGCVNLEPQRYGMGKDRWTLLEIPVEQVHFNPPVKEIIGLHTFFLGGFSNPKPISFLLSGIMLENDPGE